MSVKTDDKLEPIDGLVVDGGEPTLQDQPTPNVEPDLSLFDIVDDTAQPEEDLAAKLAAIEAENQRLQQQADLAASMQNGFQQLASQIQPQAKPDYANLGGMPKPVQQQIPQFQLPNKEEWTSEFYTNPMDAIGKLLAPVMQTQQAAQTQQMQEMRKMMSRNNAILDNSNKDIFSKYGDEVEAYANSFTSADPYGDAVKQVRANHFMDLQNEAIEAAKQAAIEDYKAQLNADTKTPPAPVGTTNLGITAPPSAGKTRITKAELAKVKEFTMRNFGPGAGADYELMAYEHMKKNGLL